MTTHKTECTYCQLVVDAPISEHEQPPELTDDSAWEALAEQHAPYAPAYATNYEASRATAKRWGLA